MKISFGTAIIFGLLVASAAHASGPDLEGVWVVREPVTTLEPVDQDLIPLTEEGRTMFEANRAMIEAGDYSFDMTVSRCAAPGMPRLMLTTRPFKIIQRPDMVVATFEWNQLVRQIDLRENPLVIESEDSDFVIPTMKGDTTGRWEGETLIVHTTGLSPDKTLDGALPNSDQLELTERIKLVDPNTLEDRITVTDPVMYTRPWDVVLTYRRLPNDTFPFPEDVCLDRKSAAQRTWPN